MRTLIFVVGGIALLLACVGVARLLPGGPMRWAAFVFLALWLAVTVFNMWFGVARAGYSFAEEWPIFLINYGVPSAVAAFLLWKIL